MAGARNPLQATVEDCPLSENSDCDEVTFRPSPVGNEKANVAAKRSNPDVKDKSSSSVANGGHSDLHSDSGYSSHTAATMSSADSGPSAKGQSQSQSPPLAPPSAASGASAVSEASSTAASAGRRARAGTETGHAVYNHPPPSPAIKRRSTVSRPSDESRQGSTSSPRRTLGRTGSVSTRGRRMTVTKDDQCTDPNCRACPGSRGRKPKMSLDISGPPFDDVRSQRSDPAPTTSYTSPPTPSSYARAPQYYGNGTAVIQPNPAPRPRRASSITRTRPISISGDPYAGSGYWPNGGPQYPSHEQHGPPPAMGNYAGMAYGHPMAAYGMQGATPPNPYYGPQPVMPMPSPYDPRPPMQPRTSSGFGTRPRPTSMYGTPLLTQDTKPSELPSARFHSKTPSSASQPTFPHSQFEFESSDESDDSYDEEPYVVEDNSRALMPPPKLKVPSHRRPSLRQTSSSKSERRNSILSNSMALESQQQMRERERDREPKSSRTSSTAVSRSASVSRRPALVQHPKAQSDYPVSRAGKVMIEDSRNSRRRSYHPGLEKEYRLEADDRIIPSRSRRQPEAEMDDDEELNSGTKLRDQFDDAEAYLQRTRGSETPFNDQVHRAAKRGSRFIASDARTTRSKNSDKASRVSQTTNGGGGEIRLRVDASAPLSLQFNGDMDGRTLQIQPTEDGMADIVIGSQRGEERSYHSERGSNYGSSKKSVVNRSDRSERLRRDPDDVSSRASRGGQTRREREYAAAQRERDADVRPLRRKGELRYHG